MNEPDEVTGYADVDHVVHWFLVQAQALLGGEFVGMYLVGSLALGDFDPVNSDIDFIVVTETALTSDVITALSDMHARFDQSGSRYSEHVEAVYAERDALRHFPPGDKAYPQVETGRSLFVEPLESGWMFQCWTLRERGVVLAGPLAKDMIPPLNPNEMRRAGALIPLMWQCQAREDCSWLAWLRERQSMSFVVLTLCRLLYTLDLASVASKPAAHWVQQTLGEPWSPLIASAVAGKHSPGSIAPWEEQQTLALIDFTVVRFREPLSPME
jgi:hypothetical protein